MKKYLATLLFAVLLAFPAAAQGTGDAVVMTSQGDRATVTVTLPQNEASGVTSLSLSFDVQKGTEGSVQFDFSDTLQSSVQQYRYNAETGRLTVYLSGTKPIFTDGSAMLGTIRLDSAKSAAASVRVGEDSLKLVNAAFGSTVAQITEQSVDLAVTVDDGTPESPSEPETPVLPETPDSSESAGSAGSADAGQTTSGESHSSASAASSAGTAKPSASSRPADSDSGSDPADSAQTSSVSSAGASSSAAQSVSEAGGETQPSSDTGSFPVWIPVFLTAAGAAVVILAVILIRRTRR